MDFQKEPPEKVLDILKKEKVEYLGLDYFAFPETFGSTAGPRKGIGGSAMSTFTVEAYVCDGIGPTVYVCTSEYKFTKGRYQASWNARAMK
jgi:hypothetical protein